MHDMDDRIWTPGWNDGDDTAAGGPIFVHTTIPEGNVTSDVIKRLVNEAWALHMEDRERAAYIIAWHTLPRGFKWAVEHPKVLRALKRLRIWKPPAINWTPAHPNCRSSFVPFTD